MLKKEKTNQIMVKTNGKDNPTFVDDSGKVKNSKPQDHHATVVNVVDEESENARANWGNGLEFLFSCIAMSVGLGNLWRFPFICYENG